MLVITQAAGAEDNNSDVVIDAKTRAKAKTKLNSNKKAFNSIYNNIFFCS